MAPKRKSTGDLASVTPKKSRTTAVDEDQSETPSKSRTTAVEVDESHISSKSREIDQSQTPSKQKPVADTPSKQRSILKTAHAHLNITNGQDSPKSLRKVLFSTPAKGAELELGTSSAESPLTAARNADRSAKRKSSRRLFHTDPMNNDDDDGHVGEDVARQILDMDEEDEESEDNHDIDNESDNDTIAVTTAAPDTPSKDLTETPSKRITDTPSKENTAKLRGRPKGKRRARSATPPDNLPPHELYFFQNRPGGTKTSTNTLPTSVLLNHDDYFAAISTYKDAHQDDMAILSNMHAASFEQWALELDEGFNICLYGYGSKRSLLLQFADYLHDNPPNHSEKAPLIVVVNGYNPSLALRDILTGISTALLGPSVSQKLPQQPLAHLDALLSALSSNPPNTPLRLLIHSIDAPPLRKHQLALSRLAASPHISLTTTADTSTFPLLWDISLRSTFHFVFHDTTTFAPYTAELDAVDDVNALLGRSGRRVGGKDGVAYVLRSLPENARNLYRILVAEQLALADAAGDDDGIALRNGAGFFDDDADMVDEDELLGHATSSTAATGRFDYGFDDGTDVTPSKRIRKGRPAKRPAAIVAKVAHIAQAPGVEYRTLYHKAVEEFVCSSEMSFRTLLKEFHDHAMVESRRDAQGTERLSVPFGREELEEILGELV